MSEETILIKAVVFDFNGTLYWDSHHQEDSWDEYLLAHNIVLSEQEKNLHIHGRNGKDSFEYIFKTSFSAEEIKGLVEEKEVYYRKACLREEMKLAPGAIELLSFLKKNKIPMAIATASGKTNVDFFIEKFSLLDFFHPKTIIYDNGKILGKPNPDLFLKAMDSLSVAPRQTIIFEDSISGILAAERSGVGKVVVVNSTGKISQKNNHQVIKSFYEFDSKLFLK
jgi:HAD superfamily hydrolase (TIGR01509 family)